MWRRHHHLLPGAAAVTSRRAGPRTPLAHDRHILLPRRPAQHLTPSSSIHMRSHAPPGPLPAVLPCPDTTRTASRSVVYANECRSGLLRFPCWPSFSMPREQGTRSPPPSPTGSSPAPLVATMACAVGASVDMRQVHVPVYASTGIIQSISFSSADILQLLRTCVHQHARRRPLLHHVRASAPDPLPPWSPPDATTRFRFSCSLHRHDKLGDTSSFYKFCWSLIMVARVAPSCCS